MYINKAVMVGKVASDPEVKEINANLRCGSFSIVTEYVYKSRGTKEPCFIDCVAWNDLCEEISGLKKGDLVAVSGRIKQDRWLDKESGRERTKHIFLADSIVSMGSVAPAQDNRGAEHILSELPF